MSEAIVSIICSVLGVCVIVCCFVVLAIRGRGNQAITWKGFGVVFEIRPCRDCAMKGKP